MFIARARKLPHMHTQVVNSMYLMLATGAVAGFGFIFWLAIARHFKTADVGLATTLLSASGLISLLSLMGLDTSFVRYLPKSTRKNDYINSGLLIVALMSAVFAVIFLLVIAWKLPSLRFVTEHATYAVGFVFFTMMTSLNTVTNAVFLAHKRAGYILGINIAFSALKASLPFAVSSGNAMTIFTLAGLAQLAGVLLSLLFMHHKLEYRFSAKVHVDIVRTLRRYSLAMYAASILNLLPPTLLPLLVIQKLGAEQAAYYYIAFTIASALYTIAYASMQSAFAEGSHNESAMRQHLTRAAGVIIALLVPAVIGVMLFGNIILGAFGKNYVLASGLLRMFALGAILVAVYSGIGAFLRVTHHLRNIVIMNIVYAAVILGLSVLLLKHHGLTAVGWAWLAGNGASIGIAAVLLIGTKLHRGNDKI